MGDQGEEAPCQIKYQTKLKILKIVKKCLNNFRLFAVHFKMESSVVKWSFFLMTKIQDVWKLTALCRLFHSSSFRASFPVSTKEFLWDLSFNVNLFFQGFLAYLTNFARIPHSRGGDVNQAWLEEMLTLQPFTILAMKRLVDMVIWKLQGKSKGKKLHWK